MKRGHDEGPGTRRDIARCTGRREATPETGSFGQWRDGRRFLAIKTAAQPPSPTITRINLIQNRFEELKAKVPVR